MRSSGRFYGVVIKMICGVFCITHTMILKNLLYMFQGQQRKQFQAPTNVRITCFHKELQVASGQSRKCIQ